MKRINYLVASLLFTAVLTGCGGATGKKADEKQTGPQHIVLENPQVDLSEFTVNKDGYIVLFDGNTLKGWRDYGKNYVPSRWIVENGLMKFNGSGGGEAQDQEGGDLIFSHTFKNFELEVEWKISKGGNSGIFYLAREVESVDPKTGNTRLEPIYISAPEAQILDNENHIDAKMGKDNNRQSSSLYDMIPAVLQNANPYGEWNTTTITVFKGTVLHGQNGENVLEYHLWTPQWTEMLQASKFSEDKWPLAFELLNNCGGPDRKGYIGLQDHGDDVWFRTIRIKLLD
ncbi:MAG: DUF1080 domain-containing protein [Bacteroides sp.]|nr:DUF1080 domain-containing protein [Bacteroides sp.]